MEKILIIGSGGREHALGWKLKQSSHVDKIYFAPGNGGTHQLGENINIKAFEIEKLLRFSVEHKIDLTVVGSEDPLALGIVDLFEKNNLKIFGPSKKASQIEASKIFAKLFMKKFKIPTASFEVFSKYHKAKKYLNKCKLPLVLKADGLAVGKGVFVCKTKKESELALKKIMIEKIFGKAGNKVVIEECLNGQEASVICFTDGNTVLPLLSAQDHKQIYNGDKGPNTGGMGAYAPTPLIDKKLMNKIVEKILKPTILGMRKIGIPYKGILYAGIMINKGEPKVLEFNCRFGDPETQPQLMLLKSDLVDLMMACINGNLRNIKIKFYSGYSMCVAIVSKGYPGDYKKGFIINGLTQNNSMYAQVFHAGTVEKNHKIITNGGRVLGVTSRGKTLKKAIKNAYKIVKKIKFKNKFYRTDIGAKAFLVDK